MYIVINIYTFRHMYHIVMSCWYVCVSKGFVAEAVEGTGRQVVETAADPGDGYEYRAGAPVPALPAPRNGHTVNSRRLFSKFEITVMIAQHVPSDVTGPNVYDNTTL